MLCGRDVPRLTTMPRTTAAVNKPINRYMRPPFLLIGQYLKCYPEFKISVASR